VRNLRAVRNLLYFVASSAATLPAWQTKIPALTLLVISDLRLCDNGTRHLCYGRNLLAETQINRKYLLNPLDLPLAQHGGCHIQEGI